ncbi:MAG: hypothetical protein ACRC0G_07540 [Fusobacteriaceae bacterium]
MESTLYMKDTYTIESLYEDAIIREYDMSEAGYSIIKEFNLLSDATLRKLEIMSKTERLREIGLLQIDNKNFSNKLKKGFEDCRKIFFQENSIHDKDVVSIKKDAIFIKDRVCKNTRFGKNIEFKLKNKYSCFMNLNGVEFYYNEKFDELDVKGVNDSLLFLHEKGMVKIIKDIIKIVNSSTPEYICSKLQKVVKDYKEFRLEPDSYREFNRYSKFKGNIPLAFAGNIYSDEFGMLGTDNVDISYNYMKYLVPLINAFY